MKFRNWYAAHEARMWIQNVIIPTVTIAVAVMATNPELRDKFSNAVKKFVH